MNLKTTEGLKFLNALLSEKVWSNNEDWLADNIFRGTDIDWINHMLSTEINGKKHFKQYERILQDPTMIEELTIIENNMK